MPLGQIARRLLGRRFQPLGEAYRAIFVDVRKIADRIARELPPHANCLDIGGGDGMIASALLDIRSDITVSMIDIAEDVGGFIAPRHAARVKIHPATHLRNLPPASHFDAFIITDVIHHIPETERAAFFQEVRAQAECTHCPLVIVKDIEPGSPRSVLSVLSDKYITGDRAVALVGRSELEDLMREAFGAAIAFSVDFPDAPNYCAVARLDGTPRTA